ncbi:hypothetical protein ACR9PT_10620 [Piscirickettsia salmonis]|uniref:hypothetical protein n=1 Tax=Piscirickettsia salmonis TaxID=1238 RepID=UPI003EBA5DF6
MPRLSDLFNEILPGFEQPEGPGSSTGRHEDHDLKYMRLILQGLVREIGDLRNYCYNLEDKERIRRMITDGAGTISDHYDEKYGWDLDDEAVADYLGRSGQKLRKAFFAQLQSFIGPNPQSQHFYSLGEGNYATGVKYQGTDIHLLGENNKGEQRVCTITAVNGHQDQHLATAAKKGGYVVQVLSRNADKLLRHFENHRQLQDYQDHPQFNQIQALDDILQRIEEKAKSGLELHGGGKDLVDQYGKKILDQDGKKIRVSHSLRELYKNALEIRSNILNFEKVYNISQLREQLVQPMQQRNKETQQWTVKPHGKIGLFRTRDETTTVLYQQLIATLESSCLLGKGFGNPQPSAPSLELEEETLAAGATPGAIPSYQQPQPGAGATPGAVPSYQQPQPGAGATLVYNQHMTSHGEMEGQQATGAAPQPSAPVEVKATDPGWG